MSYVGKTPDGHHQYKCAHCGRLYVCERSLHYRRQKTTPRRLSGWGCDASCRRALYLAKRLDQNKRCISCGNHGGPFDGSRSCRKCRNDRTTKYRLDIIKKLGGKCSICGDQRLAVLDIDHVDGGGSRARRVAGYYRQCTIVLENQHMFRLLCKCCNWLAFRYGKDHNLWPEEVRPRAKEGWPEEAKATPISGYAKGAEDV